MKNYVLVVGLGEVGMALFEFLEESGKYKVFGIDPRFERPIPSHVNILHICFPYTKNFISIVVDYVKKFRPHLVIINSTIPPQTTSKISKICPTIMIVFSPVLGIHKSRESFKEDIKYYGKFVGGITQDATEAACSHFSSIGIKTIPNSSPLEAEITKLYETTYYGVLIALAQDFHRLSVSQKADFVEIIKNICYLNDISGWKPPVYPDVIGGHCVMPNIEIFLNVLRSDFLIAIQKSNENRKKEMNDKKVAQETLKIKKVVEQYWNEKRKLREK